MQQLVQAFNTYPLSGERDQTEEPSSVLPAGGQSEAAAKEDQKPGGHCCTHITHSLHYSPDLLHSHQSLTASLTRPAALTSLTSLTD